MMKQTFPRCALLLLLVFLTFGASFTMANVRLPAVLGSHMVLQRNADVKLWGWALPNEKIKITTSWNNRVDSVVADGNASWSIKIPTPGAGGPYKITIHGYNTLVLDDIMIGEVWLCSGQSNMERNGNQLWDSIVKASNGQPLRNEQVRMFQIPRTTANDPQENCTGEWTVCDTASIKNFSAVGYFYGLELQKNLGVPIGLINASWGGTPAEVWTPKNVIDDDPLLAGEAKVNKVSKWWPHEPAKAFNGMIAPLKNFNIAGAIWYQGESNTGHPKTYDRLFTKMIQAWRNWWQVEFPFYFVQIAPYVYDKSQNAAFLREAQDKSQSLEATGMIVISDLVDTVADIHPRNKQDVGIRLAKMSLVETYGKVMPAYRSPSFKSMEIAKNKVIINFNYLPTGLKIHGKSIANAYIAGEDQIYYPADAKLKGSQLILSSKKVPEPVAARYGFANAAIGNLFSTEGFPVAPFRTDNWDNVFSPAQNIN
ncbi:sialate O-acetylesterase [Chitinophaga caeni]|nr:sialate O-acetylesterase [Chitinophaga caeni]